MLENEESRSNRLLIRKIEQTARARTFADDVRAGLGSSPKKLFPQYFYDALGSHLFEAICCLPEYYVTRAETGILVRYIDEIAGLIRQFADGPVRLVELGSGSAEKTRHFIKAFLSSQGTLHYCPIDISEDSIERSSENLLREYPGLRVTGYVADYATALGAMSAEAANAKQSTVDVVLFFGSSIGNLDPEEASSLLRDVRKAIGSTGVMVAGADLKKSHAVLIPAYDDPLGVTGAFNLNLLVRINRELGGKFDVTKFNHVATYNDRLDRVEMHLVSREDQDVPIAAIAQSVHFGEGETIHTESSYKFDNDRLSSLGASAGFDLEKSWRDDEGLFSVNLFRAS